MRKVFKYSWIAGLCMTTLYSCLPSDPDYFNINQMPIDSVTSIALIPSHYSLIADGVSELLLNVFLYKGDKEQILESRIEPDWVELYTEDGKNVDKNLKTKNWSPDTVKIYAQLKGYDQITDPARKELLKTNQIRIVLRKPQAPDMYNEITYPVIFHIIQTSDDITGYGVAETFRLYEYFDKLNKVFARECNVSPNGVDTRIKFKLAEYDPYGQKLPEIGVNRYTLPKGAVGNDYNTFIQSKKLDWDYNRYLNVWLIMGASQPLDKPCRPYYIASNADKKPEGLTFTETNDVNTLPKGITPLQAGILIDLKAFTSYKTDIQDITFYFGRYLGLLDNTADSQPENYCDDTFSFPVSSGDGNLNKKFMKEVTGDDNQRYYFISDNIMDDAVGMHKTVNMDQSSRIREIVKWCPARQQYQSDFAFTGK